MRIDLGATLGYALHAFAAALLGVALLDYLAYEFVFVDLVGAARSLSPWDWWPDPVESLAGRALVTLTLVGGATAFGAFALARVRRTARALLTVAAGCAALQLAVAVACAWWYRERALADIVTVEPATSIRWLEHGGWWIHEWTLSAQSVAGALASTTIVATLLAGVRVALHRGWSHGRTWPTVALALPLLLATGALTRLWDEFGSSRSSDSNYEHWVPLVQSARWAIVAAALAATIAAALLLRGPPRPHLGRAAGLFALALAAFAVTAPHRRMIDTHYPLPRLHGYTWFPLPLPAWEFDAPVAGRCVERPAADADVVVTRGGDGVFTMRINNFEVSLVGDVDVRAELDRRLYWSGPLLLYADRRVPVAALMPLFEQLPPTAIGRVLVAGLTVQEMPSADGPVLAWGGCVYGELQVPALLRTRPAPDTTWGAILDDPALVSGAEAP